MNGNECVSVSSDQFLKMRTDADKILQKLVKNMIEKDSEEGELTIKIAVKFIPEYVDNGPGKTARKALKPSYEHKVSSTMKIQDSEAGKSFDDMKEVVFDEETGQYVTRYIHGAEQMNIFEYEEQRQKEEEHKPIEDEGHLLLGPTNMIEDMGESPENDDRSSEALEGIIDADYRVVDDEPESESENAGEGESEAESSDPGAEIPQFEADQKMGNAETPQDQAYEDGDIPFLSEYEEFDNYSYDDPEEPDPDEEMEERWL